MWNKGILVFSLLLALPLTAMSKADWKQTITQQEQKLKADIGVALLSSDGEVLFEYQGNRAFPLNSTHKAFICGIALDLAEDNALSFTQKLPIQATDIVSYSPITKNKTTMNLAELCSAAVSYSDNTAANLIVKQIGGVKAVSDYFKQHGLNKTRLDRREPEMNRDNLQKGLDLTTPIEAARLLHQFVFTDLLTAPSKMLLTQWMLDDQVANDLLRSTLPEGWKIADKTGAGSHGSRSIISIFWKPDGTGYLLSIYLTNTRATMAQRNQAIAEIGRVIFEQLP
ncbi:MULTISPECIES: class A beta-lactamase [unclassified Pasteurella]|uniref:class A beta-lactamase n=1 Tax=unclassified Pasteurella TaxID=2621516 RepID=UPI0010747BED|nr:class A beta-lactamase [Pasteurella sp. 19428wF3_WM03]TFU52884.1 class A beta-lactamase [Pasteurella sp. WM03]